MKKILLCAGSALVLTAGAAAADPGSTTTSFDGFGLISTDGDLAYDAGDLFGDVYIDLQHLAGLVDDNGALHDGLNFTDETAIAGLVLDGLTLPGDANGDAVGTTTTFAYVDIDMFDGLQTEDFAMTDGVLLDVIDSQTDMAFVATTPTPSQFVIEEPALAYGPGVESDGLSGDLMQTASVGSLVDDTAEYGAVVLASFDPGVALDATVGGSRTVLLSKETLV